MLTFSCPKSHLICFHQLASESVERYKFLPIKRISEISKMSEDFCACLFFIQKTDRLQIWKSWSHFPVKSFYQYHLLGNAEYERMFYNFFDKFHRYLGYAPPPHTLKNSEDETIFFVSILIFISFYRKSTVINSTPWTTFYESHISIDIYDELVT